MTEEIDIGAISEVLNEKVDRDWNNLILPNDMGQKLNTSGVRTIMESYKNGTDWYRLWSDGWIEQGGSMSTSSTVNFLKPFRDTTYYIDVTWNGGKSSEFYPSDWKITKALSSFTTTATTNGSNVRGLCWYVCGFI